jgi:glutathione S-transferase
MITLVGTVKSRALRPIWLAEELGLDFEHLPAKPRSEEALRHSPSGKVPALVEDGAAITDSTAILAYLADRFGGCTAPAGTQARARQDAAMHWALDELDAVLWTAARHSFVLPEAQRVPQVKDSLRWEFARSIERLDARLRAQEFAGGDAFSIADIVTAHCLRWAGNAKFPVEEEAVLAYRERMLSRPAFQRAAARE